MASANSIDPPVLCLLPPEAFTDEVVGIAWPSLMYQVCAPEVVRLEMDLFERAVFGLCRAGLRDRDAVAELLEFDRELVAVVSALMQGRRWLDSYGIPTELGLRTWEADAWTSGELRVGHVLQDPWTGNLWPVFLEDLPDVRCRSRSVATLRAELGSHGRARRLELLRVAGPPGDPPAPPSARDVLDACERHARRFRDGREGAAGVDEAVRQSDRATAERLLPRVAVFERPPIPVLLTSGLVPSDLDEPDGWAVLDPARVGLRNGGCRTSLVGVLAENTTMAERFAKPLASIRKQGIIRHRNQETQPLVERVAAKVPLLPRTSSVFTRCCELEYLWGNLRPRSEAAGLVLRRAILVEAQALLEKVLEELMAEYPSPDAWKVLNPGDPHFRQQNRALLEAKALTVGFRAPIPHALCALDRGDVRVAVEENRGSLRARIVAVVLAASSHREHPLRDVAHADPGILARWDTIARTRNRKAAHGGGNTEPVRPEEASDAVECVYHTIRLLPRLWAGLGEAKPF